MSSEMIIKFMLIFLLGFILVAPPCFGLLDTDVISRQTKTIVDADGEVTITLEWLRRPGEFALTIDYYGYLIQEGTVNAYLSVNGVHREFITLRENSTNRHQIIKILSFHPNTGQPGPKSLKKLEPHEMVDYLLFRNAPYYAQFGTVKIECKFFAHGRWDGNSNENNENYRVEFKSQLTDMPQDHF